MKTRDISKLQAPCQNIIETMGIPGAKAIILFLEMDKNLN